MEALKKYFPLSFREKNEISRLLVSILLYLALALGVGLVMGIFSGIPVINWLFGFIGVVAEIYIAVGVALAVLDYLKIVK